MSEVGFLQQSENYQPSGLVVNFKQSMQDAVEIAKSLIMGGFISPTTYAPSDKEVDDVALFFESDDKLSVKRQMTLHRTASAVLAAQRIGVPFERISSTLYVYNNIVSVFGPFVFQTLVNSPDVKNLNWKFEGQPEDFSLKCTATMLFKGEEVSATYDCQDAIRAGSMPFYNPETRQFYKVKSGRNGSYNISDSWCTNIKMMFQYKIAHNLIKTNFGDILGGYSMHVEADGSDLSSAVQGQQEADVAAKEVVVKEVDKQVAREFAELMESIEEQIAERFDDTELIELLSETLKNEFKRAVDHLDNAQIKKYRYLLKAMKIQMDTVNQQVAESVMSEPVVEDTKTAAEIKKAEEFTSVSKKGKKVEPEPVPVEPEPAVVVDFNRPTGHNGEEGIDVLANFYAVKGNITNPILFKTFCEASAERRQKLWNGWITNNLLKDNSIVPLIHANWKLLAEENK